MPPARATQAAVEGTICGPVRIQIEGFRPIYNEVLFLDMEPANGDYEPLIGYVILEQSQAAVDMLVPQLTSQGTPERVLSHLHQFQPVLTGGSGCIGQMGTDLHNRRFRTRQNG